MDNKLSKFLEELNKENDIINKAKLLHRLIHEQEIRIIELSKATGKTPSYICHLLRLAKLPEIIIDGYYAKQVTISHLFIISRIKDEKILLETYEEILAKNLNILQTEEKVREKLHQINTRGSYLSHGEKLHYINIMKSKYRNLDMKIIQTRIKGKIIFEIKSDVENSTAIIKKIMEKLMK